MGRKRRRLSNYIFAALFGMALILFARIVLPFLMPILLSAFLCVLFSPLQNWLLERLKLRRQPAAALSTGAVFLVILVPLVVVSFLVSREVLGFAAEGKRLFSHLDEHGGLWVVLPPEIRKQLTAARPLGITANMLTNGFGVVGSLLSATTGIAADAFLMAVALYYFFLDGQRLYVEATQALPVDPRYVTTFSKEFRDVARAMIYGNALTGLLQGLTGYLGFLFAGVSHAYVWGVATIVATFVPVLGTALVWAPLSAALIVGRHVGAGLFLIAWGLIMVGVVDNFIRPRLYGARMTLHPLLVFLSMFGGVAVFGMMGVLVGPLIASIFMAMVRIGRRDFLIAPPKMFTSEVDRAPILG